MRQLSRIWLGLALGVPFAGCGGTAVIDGSGGSSASTAGGDGASCPVAPSRVGRICLRGEPTDGGELVDAERPLRIELSPSGCFSSSCTKIASADCDVTRRGTTLEVDGRFCLPVKGGAGEGCTDDCYDISLACNPVTVTPGSYTIDGPGDLDLTFEVPSTVPLFGLCVGRPY